MISAQVQLQDSSFALVSINFQVSELGLDILLMCILREPLLDVDFLARKLDILAVHLVDQKCNIWILQMWNFSFTT
jgi:hypothetical protein